jgi:hypothetical protein
MTTAERNKEIAMMLAQIIQHGHVIKRDSSLCLSINGRHEHQSSIKNMHAFLSGYLAAVETYEWRDAKGGP